MEIIDSAANNSLKKIINNYRDTHDFLSKYSIPKNVDLNSTNPKPITNTRIPDIKLNIHGGKYSIPDEEYETFLQLYALDVIFKKKKEYLTEKQLDNGGPLLIDIDFRYEYEIDEKQHQFDLDTRNSIPAMSMKSRKSEAENLYSGVAELTGGPLKNIDYENYIKYGYPTSKSKSLGYENPFENQFQYIDDDIQNPDHVVFDRPTATRLENRVIARPKKRDIY